MAEDKTQETRSSLPPRRGPRPFVGPAGSAGQALPLLRVTPMPRPAPFVPAPVARPSLGATPRAVTPSAATIAAERAPTIETPAVAPAEPEASAVTPTDAALEALVAWSGAGVDSAESAAEIVEPVSEPAADPLAEQLPSEAPQAPAGDQFAALDTTWHEGAMPSWLMDDAEVSPAVQAASPASDAVAAEAEANPAAEPQAAAAPDTADAEIPTTVAGGEGSWADVTIMVSADSIMAAEVEASEAPATPTADHSAGGVFSEEAWPDPLLAEYAVYMPTPSIGNPAMEAASPAAPSVSGEEPPAAAGAADSSADNADGPPVVTSAASPVIEDEVEESPTPMALSAAWTSDPANEGGTESADSDEPAETHASRVATALDRLAEQVRRGEIDVSSVAPGGPDAAVLAGVLAALLGGGRSSSR